MFLSIHAVEPVTVPSDEERWNEADVTPGFIHSLKVTTIVGCVDTPTAPFNGYTAVTVGDTVSLVSFDVKSKWYNDAMEFPATSLAEVLMLT